MLIRCFIFTMLLAPYLWSENINITLNDAFAQQEYLFAYEQENPVIDHAAFHQELLLSSSVAKIPRSVEFNINKILIDSEHITRTMPIIDGLEVEGADGVFTAGHESTFNYTYFDLPKEGFKLNAAEALEKAMAYNNASLIKDPYVEKIEGSYVAMWLMHFGELRPAYKTRLPTLSVVDLQDIYIDAQNGEILKIEDSAHFIDAPSRLFEYSPGSDGQLARDLRAVSLKNLTHIQENDFLRGQYISVRNCCHYFTCPLEGPCTDATKRCALESHQGARQTRELIQLPTASLGLDPLLSLPPVISVDTVRCTYLPFAKASYSPNGRSLGFFETPIDEPGIASDMDRFSEVQAYYSVSTFFNHIRFLLANPAWCLRKSAMSCNEDGSPALDSQGQPIDPYRVFVNQMIPDMKLNSRLSSEPENFIAQILGGKGSHENPIKLNSLTRMGNAAFVPAVSSLKATTPRADEILSDLLKPYDHNVFFQGARDFAYDGDVVFHEFMHAVTTSMVNKLNSLGLNKWGIHSEPGSLNEGWSDYFAAAFTNSPTVGAYASIKDGFGEASLRNIENTMRCPENVIGEIHNDGLVWSGALWEIRNAVLKDLGKDTAIEFDRAVLSALAQAKTSEDFKNQSEKLLTSIRSRASLGPNIAAMAEKILEQRGLRDCFRAFALSKVDKKNNVEFFTKNTLMVPSKNQIGLKNYAPSSSQLEIAIPAGAKSLTISWRQFLGGTGALLGTETTPDKANNIIPLGLMTSFTRPIEWKFSKAMAIATQEDKPLSNAPVKAYFNKGRWQYTQDLQLNPCEQSKFFVSLLSYDFKYLLEDIKVSFIIDESPSLANCNFSEASHEAAEPVNINANQGCSTTNASEPGFYYVLLLTLFFLKILKI